MKGLTEAEGGLAILGLTAAPAVMSCFLPSPGTAYDKASGAISTGPDAIKMLRRDEVLGAITTLAIAAAVSMILAQKVGAKAAWVFLGAVAILAGFIWEYEAAIRRGMAHRDGGAL